MTPLMWAARWGDADRVKALLEAGADVNTVDKTGRTALDWAHTRGDKAQETVELLEPLTD
jgi:ankyrin repeat protein